MIKITDRCGKIHYIKKESISCVAESLCIIYPDDDSGTRNGTDVWIGSNYLTIDMSVDEFMHKAGLEGGE